MEEKTMKIAAIAVVAILVIGGVVAVVAANNNNGSGEKAADIRIAFANSSGMQPMIYAYYAGLFEAEGITVDATITKSSGPCVTAFIAGTVDVTFTSPEPVFNVINDGNIKGKYIGNSRLPGISSMHLLYNETKIDTTKMIKLADGTDSTVIDFASQVVDETGAVKGKIALHLASSYRTAWLGYVELLYSGGTVYGVTYKAGQINETQYNKLMNTNDESVYIGCADYAAAAAATTTGQSLLGIGSNSAMAKAADTANADAGTTNWKIMSTPSLVDSGFATILATDEILENKFDVVVKLLRAIDKAGALMRDPSTAKMVAEVCAERINGEATEKTIQDELTYYNQVQWDICWINNVDEVFNNIAKISGLKGSFSTIYDVDMVKKLMKEVHYGANWERDANWDLVSA